MSQMKFHLCRLSGMETEMSEKDFPETKTIFIARYNKKIQFLCNLCEYLHIIWKRITVFQVLDDKSRLKQTHHYPDYLLKHSSG